MNKYCRLAELPNNISLLVWKCVTYVKLKCTKTDYWNFQAEETTTTVTASLIYVEMVSVSPNSSIFTHPADKEQR